MRIYALTLGLALLLVGPQDAHATTYRDLCSSVPDACELTGPNAPVLAANVCWSRSTSLTRLMTGATCPSGSYPFFAKYAVVDPLTQIVTGFVPLDDACSVGLCQPAYLTPVQTWEAIMCCIEGTCWPAESLDCPGGQLLFCDNGVTNEDGTVDCFDPQDA